MLRRRRGEFFELTDEEAVEGADLARRFLAQDIPAEREARSSPPPNATWPLATPTPRSGSYTVSSSTHGRNKYRAEVKCARIENRLKAGTGTSEGLVGLLSWRNSYEDELRRDRLPQRHPQPCTPPTFVRRGRGRSACCGDPVRYGQVAAVPVSTRTLSRGRPYHPPRPDTARPRLRRDYESGTGATVSGVNDANLQLLAKIRGQLVDRLQPEGLLGLDGHILVALRFHRLVRLTKVRKKEGDGAAWEAFFAAHVPNLAAHGRTLWADWRTKLIKDDTPGTLVAIGEGDPRSHGNVYEGKVFVNLESVADDYIAAVDSVMAACGKMRIWPGHSSPSGARRSGQSSG